MITMLLWLYSTNIEQDVKQARVRFQEKYDSKANTIWFRPGVDEKLTFEGLDVKHSGTITKSHFGLSRE